MQNWHRGSISSGWNQRPPITSYLPRLSSEVQYLHWLLSWQSGPEAYMQHSEITPTFKNVKHSEEERRKTLLEAWTTRSTWVIFNCFLMCKQRSSITFTLKHLSSLIILHPHSLFLNTIISPTWSGFKNMWSVSIILNYLPRCKLKPWSPPNFRANKIWSSPIFFSKNDVLWFQLSWKWLKFQLDGLHSNVTRDIWDRSNCIKSQLKCKC